MTPLFAGPDEYAADGVAWCESHLRLPPDSASPGPLKFRRWQRAMLRSMLDPAIVQTAAAIATQMGKTTLMMAGLGYVICNEPQKVLLALPNEELRGRFQEEKIEKSLVASPVVKERLIPTGKGTLGKQYIRFVGGGLYYAISGSEATMSSIDAQLVIGDEVERYARLSDSANPLSNLESRGEAFEGRERRWLFSTPGDADRSLIWPEVMRGGGARLYVSCPHCGEMQVWEEERVRNAVIYCGGCAAAWDEEQRLWSLDSGPMDWRLQERAQEGYAGYQLSALYSRRPLAHTMARCPGDRRAFVNQVLALPYKSTAFDRPDADALESIFDVAGPEEPDCVTLSVDVQKDRLEAQITHFDGLFPHTHLLARIARPAQDSEAWGELRALWDYHQPDITVIDRSKFAGTDVRMNVERYLVGGPAKSVEKRMERMNIWLLKGVTTSDNVMVASVHKNRREMNINASACKAAVYRLLELRTDENGNPLPFGMSADAGGVPPDYLRQLTAEECVYRLVNGKEKEIWQLRPGERRNEALDMEGYALAGRAHLGLAYRRGRRVELDPEMFG